MKDKILAIKYCECGCGQIPNNGKRFVHGHHAKGKGNGRWKGGKTITKGYVSIYNPNHPRADTRNYVPEHILIIESILGKIIPLKAECHHVDGDKSNNRNSNLVLYENHKYHYLLHKRIKALYACGNPNADRCYFCGKWEINMHKDNRGTAFHKQCKAFYDKQNYEKRRAYVN